MKSLIAVSLTVALFVACDQPQPTGQAQPAPKTVAAAEAPVAADKAATVAAAEPQDKKAAPLAGTDKASCGGQGDSTDCPFADEKKLAKAGEGELGCGAYALADTEKATPSGTAHFGADFTLSDVTPLSAVLAKAADASTVKVSGTIAKVCAKKGCWMVVKDGEAEARVVMKGYAFTVPTDSKGKDAVVEGTLKVKTFTEAQAKHLAEDGGEDPSKVVGERKEFLLTATGIDIKS